MAANVSSTLRMNGLISGLDVDAIVSNTMRYQQLKSDSIKKNVDYQTWTKSAYTDINNALRKFKDTYASALSSSNLVSPSAFKTTVVNTTDTTGAATITAGAGAANGAHTINSIKQIALGATASTGKASTFDSGLMSTRLNTTTLGEMPGNIFAAGALETGSNDEGEDVFSFSINGVDFEFGADATLKQVMDKVNSSKAGVTMSYSQLTDTFSIASKTTGKDSTIDVRENAGNLLETLGFKFSLQEMPVYDENGNVVKDDDGEIETEFVNAADFTAGQNALLTIDGIDIERDTNNFTIDGVNYKLNKSTIDSNGVNTPINFTLSKDTDAAVDRVKAMIEAYNTLVDDLYAAVNTKKNKDYQPLTEEEKYSMTEDQITKWEDMAKQGILYRDSGVQNLLDKVRTSLTETVEGFGSLASIGITGTKYRIGEAAHLELTEEGEAKLRAALESDPDMVAGIFGSNVRNGTKLDTAKSGVMFRITDLMDSFVNNTRDVKIKDIDDNLRDLSKSYDLQLDKNYQLETSLYLQYSRMESAMAQLQSQTSSLAGLS